MDDVNSDPLIVLDMYLEVILIEKNEAQQRSAHAPLVSEIASKCESDLMKVKVEVTVIFMKRMTQAHRPAVFKHDDVQHCLQHLLEDLWFHL